VETKEKTTKSKEREFERENGCVRKNRKQHRGRLEKKESERQAAVLGPSQIFAGEQSDQSKGSDDRKRKQWNHAGRKKLATATRSASQ